MMLPYCNTPLQKIVPTDPLVPGSLNCANLKKNTHIHTQIRTEAKYFYTPCIKKVAFFYTHPHTKYKGGKLLRFLLSIMLGLVQLCRTWNINHTSTFLNWEHNAQSINVFFQSSLLLTTGQQRPRNFIFSFMFLLLQIYEHYLLIYSNMSTKCITLPLS